MKLQNAVCKRGFPSSALTDEPEIFLWQQIKIDTIHRLNHANLSTQQTGRDREILLQVFYLKQGIKGVGITHGRSLFCPLKLSAHLAWGIFFHVPPASDFMAFGYKL